MTLHKKNRGDIPLQTARVARAAFPNGNVYMMMRDELGAVYSDDDFATLYEAECGQPALSPAVLALVTVMQFAEGLTDRQAADQVRARIDWKYALGLELTNEGFDYSILSEFRSRLIAGGRSHQLLDAMLKRFSEKGWIKARGRARTDSTHVLGAIRQLNRLECVGETLRCALNELATVAPDWLLAQVGADWFERYSNRFEQYRLPKTQAEGQRLARTIGEDGHHLLSAIYAESTLVWLRELPAVGILRTVWVQQYYIEASAVEWRKPEDLPPHKQLISSPYDPEARNRTKRDINWTGNATCI